jgi:hypothetical protein
MQFSPAFYHFTPIWSKYSPQHCFLKHPPWGNLIGFLQSCEFS